MGDERARGAWKIDARLADGTTARAWLATHPERDGEWVLKEVPLQGKAQDRFLNEVAALLALRHEGIVTAEDAGLTDTSAWLVMPRVRGRTLLAYRARPPLPPAVVLGFGAQLAAALAHAHARGVYHRDLKPANGIVDGEGRVTLVDFGVALVADRDRLTGGGPGPATPAYAPPEWFRRPMEEVAGPDDAAAADVYALGVVLVELLGGTPAFPRCGLDDLAAVKDETAHLPAPEAPPSARPWIERMTAADPRARPSMAEVAAALAEWPRLPVPPDATVMDHGDASVELAKTRLGRYELGEELGRGGGGVVYRAWDPLLARHVAIKRLFAVDPAAVARFVREARVAARLQHPNLVRALDFGDDDGPYYAMELVEGGDLRERARRPVSTAEAVSWVRAIADALAAAHDAGLVHRDVKPANILLEGGTHPRLTDFGLALADDASRVTGTGQVLGSPAYMAPEQVRGEPVTPRTDVYGLGAVLYELLAGRPLFPQDHPAAILHRVLHEPPPALPPSVPAALDRVARRALQKEPAARYATMAELAADLDRFARGAPVLARPSRAPMPAAWLGAGAAALVAALWLGGAAWRGAASERAAAERLAHALQDADPEAALSAFVAVPEHAGTRALVEAWLARAAAAGDADQARIARVEAWLAAERVDDRQTALGALGRQLDEEWDWDGLAAVVAELDDPRLAAVSAAALRDFGGAAALGPAVARLSRALPMAWSGPLSRPVDLDADGRIEWIVSAGADASFGVASEPGRPPRRLDALGGGWTALAIAGAGADGVWAVGHRDGRMILLRLDGAPRILASWPAHHVQSAARGDLDGDGVPEIYVGTGLYDRDLWRIDPDGRGGWRRTDAHPPTSGANGDVTGLLIADLRGGGAPSLFVRTASFGGYDVRELAGRPLDWVRRVRLGDGSIDQLVRFGPDRLATLVTGGPSTHLQVLGPDLRPEPPIRLKAGSTCAGLFSLDFDGDGADDLATSCGGSLALWSGGALVRVGGIGLWGVGDVDRDGAPDLMVTDLWSGGSYALGAGTGALPKRVQPERAAPPPEADGAMAAAWERAEALRAMGQRALARREFERVATLAGDGPVGGRALLRAVACADVDRPADGAPEQLLRAASIPELAEEARPLAVAALAEAHRFAEAATAGGAEWAALGEVSTVDVSFARGLPPGWVVDDPLQLTVDAASGALRVHAVRDGLLAHVPVDVDARRVGIEVELEVGRLDWGATVQIGLGHPGAPDAYHYTVGVAAEGSRDHHALRALGFLWGEKTPVAAGEALTLASDWAPPSLLWTARGPAAHTSVVIHSPPLPPLTGEWELRLFTDGREGPSIADVTIRRVGLVGIALRAAPLTRGEQARLALASGRPEAALAGLVDPWERAAALEALGRWGDAETALQVASASPGRVRQVLVERPRWIPAVRQRVGAAWPATLLDAVGLTAVMHPGDPGVDRALLDALGPLPPGVAPEVAAELERLRAGALRRAGSGELAQRAADAAVGWARRLPQADSAAWVEAALARVDADPAGAVGLLVEALARSPSPEVAADGFAEDPRLAPLRDRPEWAPIEAARRL